MLTPPRCWRAHSGGRPNAYTVFAVAGCLNVMSNLIPFISKPLPFNSEVSVGLGYLSAVLPQGDKIDIERYGGQNISRQLGVKWGTGE